MYPRTAVRDKAQQAENLELSLPLYFGLFVRSVGRIALLIVLPVLPVGRTALPHLSLFQYSPSTAPPRPSIVLPQMSDESMSQAHGRLVDPPPLCSRGLSILSIDRTTPLAVLPALLVSRIALYHIAPNHPPSFLYCMLVALPCQLVVLVQTSDEIRGRPMGDYVVDPMSRCSRGEGALKECNWECKHAWR